jgi:hypothetical protein
VCRFARTRGWWLQATYRRHAASKKYKLQKVSAVRLEAKSRAFLARKKYLRFIRALVKLQANFRRQHIRRSHAQVAEGRRRWRAVLDDREAVVLQVCDFCVSLSRAVAKCGSSPWGR